MIPPLNMSDIGAAEVSFLPRIPRLKIASTGAGAALRGKHVRPPGAG
jgi:hypothetical protein